MHSQCEVLSIDGLDVVVWLNSATDPPAEEWSRLCRELKVHVERRKCELSTFREFVVTDGGTPDAAQRKEHAVDVFRDFPVPIAVVTSVVAKNPVKRGIATVVSWMNPNFRVFEPAEVLFALDHIGVDRARFDVIGSSLRLMRSQMPPNRTFELVTREFEARCEVPSADRYGPYKIAQRIGSGGTADVYQAIHVDLGIRVALKVVRPHAGLDEERVRRTVDRYRAAAAIRHPHVVTVFDVGRRGKTPYVAMELLDGPDLAAWYAQRPDLSLPLAVDLMLPILAGTSAIHREGLVHRDLKPSNVIVAQRSGSVDPVIVDFGVAKFIDAGAVGLSAKQTGAGTPQYMSPEQVLGLSPSPKSDQYSLGLMLYELATGERPFSIADRYELLHSIATGSIPRPGQIRPSLPPAFDAIVLRAMARDPASRFDSVRSFGNALCELASPASRYRWSREF